MRRLLIVLTVLALLTTIFAGTTAMADESQGESVQLWPADPPTGNGSAVKTQARITLFRPKEPNGAAIVICPGGGYGGLMMGPEGSLIAQWLNRHGVTGIVLQYRLPEGNSAIPLLDAQRAIRVVRTQAGSWGCDPHRIGILGFSAGGHLASTATVHFDGGDPKAADPVEQQSCRPDFAILIYPVITMGEKTHQGSKKNLLGPSPSEKDVAWFSSELQVTPDTPPAFLAHALDDQAVTADNSRMFHEALRKHGAASEFLELPSGGHGLNGYQGPMWDAWQTQSLRWLTSQKFVPEK